MHDPRNDIQMMLNDLRNKIMEIEMMMWSIPHTEEHYENPYMPPVQGDYLHPDTPTHDKPEYMSDNAYWDPAMQLWNEPYYPEPMYDDAMIGTDATTWQMDAPISIGPEPVLDTDDEWIGQDEPMPDDGTVYDDSGLPSDVEPNDDGPWPGPGV